MYECENELDGLPQKLSDISQILIFQIALLLRQLNLQGFRRMCDDK